MQELDERPMPQADSVTVRLAAMRAAAVAGELQRLRSSLSGAAAGDGWSGAARLAFDEEMADRIKQFDPAIARYDRYAASLVSYARSLDQLLPPMQTARAKLTAAPPGRAPGAPDGTGPPPEVGQEFDRLWHDWDDARRRCVTALERAAHNGEDRHGLSALWHAAGHVVHRLSHVNLAEISKALDELGDVLFVAALVLSPVPGLGEVLWAGVAVVAVAKLAVDGARVASGDKSVSRGDLAWDMAGVIPGGKLAKSAREAAGLEKTVKLTGDVKGLASDAKVVDIVPGGGLMAHEGPKAFGGHTIQRHVGKSYDFLVSRFRQPWIYTSSTFTDRMTAEHVISGALNGADNHIQEWMATTAPTLIIKARDQTRSSASRSLA